MMVGYGVRRARPARGWSPCSRTVALLLEVEVGRWLQPGEMGRCSDHEQVGTCTMTLRTTSYAGVPSG